MKNCPKCGKEVKKGEKFCSECGKNLNKETTTDQKSKIAAGVLGICLGALGVHNFYLGFTGKAVAQLLITVLSIGFLSFVSAIWGFIEGILILCGNMDVDANGNKLRD